MSAPETTIYLCSGVRLNSRYDHSTYFADTTAQQAYFRGKVVKTLPAYSFVRRSWTLKVDGDLTEAVTWNYLFFHYPSDNKYYYYFINKVEYVNDNTVELTLELDLLQTYLFDVTLGKCYIEREHVADDTVGAHTVDEGLDVGDYQTRKYKRISHQANDYAVLILASFNLQQAVSGDGSTTATTIGGTYGGIFSGLGLYTVNSTGDDIVYLARAIAGLNDQGREGIVAMWIYPKELITLSGEQTWDDAPWCKNVADVKAVTGSFEPYTEANLASGFTKHKKLLTYPYHRLHVTNFFGGELNFAVERFPDRANVEYVMRGGLSPDAGTNLSFKGYLGNNNGGAVISELSLNSPPYPTCAWNSDTYKIWLAQNSYRLDSEKNMAAFSALTSTASIVGGLAMISTGAGATVGAGMVMGGAIGMTNALNQVHLAIGEQKSASLQANQVRGTFTSSVNFCAGSMGYTIEQQFVTPERLQIISDYFTVYGYKVNRMDVPSKHNRKAFTYVKTMGCHAYGNITNEDITRIESIYDKGITWWVNGDTIGDYTLNNSTL